MILVDTTVWIDFFNGTGKPHTRELKRLIATDVLICTCGVILAETLQGFRSDAEFRKRAPQFEKLLFLRMNRKTFLAAASIYRESRRNGMTIRKSNDCMIAATAIEHGVQLLHNDRDFDQIARISALKIARFE